MTQQLPQSFAVLILEAKPYSADWNHGHKYGLAVNVETQEVIYWAQYW
jgi:hypothetical protein